MDLTYKPELAKQEVTQQNCQELLGCSVYDILPITGITGLEKDLSKIKFERDFGGIYPRFVIDITVPDSGLSLRRTIRFDYRVISNNHFRFNPDRIQQGNGLRMLDAQVESATKAGLKEIHCLAYGGQSDNFGYTGHIVWGKLGFMPTKDSLDLISQHLKGKRAETTLQELLKTKDGCDFWRDFGIDWDGVFDLAECSESRSILKEYKERKINSNG